MAPLETEMIVERRANNASFFFLNLREPQHLFLQRLYQPLSSQWPERAGAVGGGADWAWAKTAAQERRTKMQEDAFIVSALRSGQFGDRAPDGFGMVNDRECHKTSISCSAAAL